MEVASYVLERTIAGMALDVAHGGRDLRRGKCRFARLQQCGLIALHQLNQQQLKQPRHDLGTRSRRLQKLAQHLLHISAHAAAVARTEMYMTAVVGFVIEGINEELRDSA